MMLHPASILFFILATFVFWVGIFVFSSNPFNKLSRLGALLLTVLSCFLLVGYFLYSSETLEEIKTIFRRGSFPLMFAPAIWFHISVLMTKKKMDRNWLTLVIVGYFLSLLVYFLTQFTKLIFDYDTLVGPVGRFHFIFAQGPLYYFSVSQILVYFALSFVNFFASFLTLRKNGENFKLLFPVLVSALFTLGFFIIILSFIFRYNIFLQETGEYILTGAVLLLVVNIVWNRLFLEGSKNNIGREFLYSSITIFSIIAVFLSLAVIFKLPIEDLRSMLLLVIFTFLLIVSHSFYDWVMTIVRNIFYRAEIYLPRVTDEEASQALRNFNKPENLEKSILLRLNLINKEKGHLKLDRLRGLIKDSIEYFKPEEEGRTKAAVKYWILKLISNQVEEGQILWDLGFEEYPLEIAEKADGQKPRLAIERPTDYQATSRNAFISLKKEAIHDLAWRISYLEKHYKG